VAKDEPIAKTPYEAAKIIPEPCYDVDTGSKSISNRTSVLAALGSLGLNENASRRKKDIIDDKRLKM